MTVEVCKSARLPLRLRLQRLLARPSRVSAAVVRISTHSEDPGAEPFEPSTQQAQETLAEQAIEPTSTTSVPKGVKMVKRKKWQTSEVKAVEKHLNRLI
ncbi:hypothetical protein MHYP_G00360030 [Metynnis hypsauchen]